MTPTFRTFTWTPDTMTTLELELATLWGKALNPTDEQKVLRVAAQKLQIPAVSARVLLESLILSLHADFVKAEREAHESRVAAHDKAWKTRLENRRAYKQNFMESPTQKFQLPS